MKKVEIHYADDDIDDLDLFRAAVKSNGMDTYLHVYRNGDDFLKGIKEGLSDNVIAFLDLNMPIKSGFAVLKEMRESKSMKNIPVVICSTSNDENAIAVSRELGANFYIIKPRSFNELKSVINKVINMVGESVRPTKENFVIENENLKQYNG